MWATYYSENSSVEGRDDRDDDEDDVYSLSRTDRHGPVLLAIQASMVSHTNKSPEMEIIVYMRLVWRVPENWL